MPDLSILKTLLPNLADYAVYAAIAVVTLIGVFKCLTPLWNVTHALRRAIRRLQKAAGTHRDKPVWQETRFMGRRLRGSWLRFLQNAEQLDRRGLPCNVEDYINDDTVTHGPGNAQLAELIPNLLTSLGILGTFMGLMQGLTGLDMTDASSLMNGIPVLLDGMKFAFGTSVAGISCSLVFNMLNRIAQGSSYRAIDDFVESFTQLAMQRPLDNDVQIICQNQDANNMLFNATDGLASQMAGSIELAVSRAMQPVTKSMDNFIVASTRQQVEGVARIVDTFLAGMNQSLDQQFLALGQTLTDVNQHQQLTLQRVEDSLAAAQNITKEAEQLHAVSNEVMRQFESYVAQLSKASTRDERFAQEAAQLLTRMESSSMRQSETIAMLGDYQQQLTSAMENFSRQGTETLAAMQRSNEHSADAMTGAGATMQAASEQLSRSYQTFVTDVVEGLSRALGMFDENISHVVTALGNKLQGTADAPTAEIIGQLSDMQRLMTSIEATLSSSLPRETKED
ncbi:MAG: MotA/TolQ/ExbB proton channel family protein [Clostridia bacterium]|nr:MotA/TolQ/ExbB proton channel family protein [Clostridia bacterium]